MLQKSKSKTISKLKFLVLIPLMLIMLFYVAHAEEKIQEVALSEEASITGETNFDSDQVSDVPFAIVDEAPVYPGCEDLASNEEKKTCLSREVTMFVNLNFNTSLGKKLNLTGLNRIFVQFRINSDGVVEVVKVRAPHEALEEEAKRVVKSLPKMVPGRQNGKKVGVLYSLPITYRVSE